MSFIMKRGRLQSLFAYLPEQTYTWEGNKGRFKGSSLVDSRPLDIPTSWLKRPLLKLVGGFAYSFKSMGQDWRGEEIIKAGDFELLEPRTLRGDYFPLMFICPVCGKVLKSDRKPHTLNCNICNIGMQQMRFIEFHRCGYIGGITPPRCKKGCKSSMNLKGPGDISIADARRVIDWRWICSGCRTQNRVIRGCPVCRKGIVRVQPSDANPVFYPQYITVINPPSRSDYRILESPAIYPAAIAQTLGILPVGFDNLRKISNSMGTNFNRQAIRQQVAQLFNLEIDNPIHQAEIDKETDRIISKRKPDALPQDWEEKVEGITEDKDILSEFGEESISFILAKEASPVKISDLTMISNKYLRPLYEEAYPKALKHVGLTEIILLQEFPIAHIVAGYTREESDPRRVDGILNFNFFPAVEGKHPMYGQRVTTEALLFRLDPALVMNWLGYSGLINPSTKERAMYQILSRMQSVTNVFEKPHDTWTASVLGLVHSFAHSIIRALARLSGLKVESLSEYLLPYNLAFLIYPGARSEFVLGGLEHVFHNYLDECLFSLTEVGRCAFDPPCSQRNGACSVCMFIGEIACERFNTALSRHYLFGGHLDGINWRGYWYL